MDNAEGRSSGAYAIPLMTPILAASVQEKMVYTRPTGRRCIQRISPSRPRRDMQHKTVSTVFFDFHWKNLHLSRGSVWFRRRTKSPEPVPEHQTPPKIVSSKRRTTSPDWSNRMPLTLSVRCFFKLMSGPFESVFQSSSLGGFLENLDIPPGRTAWPHASVNGEAGNHRSKHNHCKHAIVNAIV